MLSQLIRPEYGYHCPGSEVTRSTLKVSATAQLSRTIKVTTILEHLVEGSARTSFFTFGFSDFCLFLLHFNPMNKYRLKVSKPRLHNMSPSHKSLARAFFMFVCCVRLAQTFSSQLLSLNLGLVRKYMEIKKHKIQFMFK